MKTILYTFLCIISMTTLYSASFAQDHKNYSTIYLYRNKSFVGSACSVRIKVGNQDFFNLNNASSAEYKLYSTGKINITGLESCNGRGIDIPLDVELGKVYYIYCDMSKFNGFLIADKEEGFKKHYDSSKAMLYEEDIRMSINNSARTNSQKSEKGQGTCFLIAPGYFITNYHCIEGAKEIIVKGIDGDFTTKYGATVAAADPSNDLALIRLGNKNVKFNSLPSILRCNVAQGEKVYAMGFPSANAMGEEVKITEGIISAKSGVQGDVSKYQISAAVNPGNSGGPLIDEQGNIIGVIYAKSTIAERAGYAIKASYLESFLKNVDGFEVPALINTIKDKSFAEKVSEWKKYIYIVESN